ncbi:Esterase/lipase/thioesterase [Tulasnella sp. 419]|nr:Esterase/lipase/thioesterase [Tulasnella sp. 419]
MLLTAGALIFAALTSQVAGHGYVPQIKIGNNYIAGWDVNVRSTIFTKWAEYHLCIKTKLTTSCCLQRKIHTPIRHLCELCEEQRVTQGSSAIQLQGISRAPLVSLVLHPVLIHLTSVWCLIGNSYLSTTPITATVAAGATVTFLWNTWPLGHYGPVINYMAKCPGSCTGWKGDSGKPWFKISQEAFVNGQWASDKLAKNNATWTVTIPKSISSGEYLLRHENLALHGASSPGGAQFYPVCVQLTVTGGGSANPSGLGFPGAYSATDPGILFNPYQGDAANAAYVPPGGPVTSL